MHLIKELYLENVTDVGDVEVSQKETKCVLLTKGEIKFSDIVFYPSLGMIYDDLYESNGCQIHTHAFYYKSLCSYEKINLAGTAGWKYFYPNLKRFCVSKENYEMFLKESKDWNYLRWKNYWEQKLRAMSQFLEVLGKTRKL